MAAKVLKGADVIASMKDRMIKEVEALKAKGTDPTMAIVRVGARPDDLAYERGATKRLDSVGVALKVVELPEDIDQRSLEEEFAKVNSDDSIHGIMLFRPLPKGLDEEPLAMMIDPAKDMDCMSPVNQARVFAGDASGYAPCTPEGVMEMLDYYGIDLTGKNVTIVGRSMVVGKPLAMLMIAKHATVTVCHTRTKDLPGICRKADIICAAAGKAGMITKDMVSEGTIVIDVGINVDEEGNLCGDVAYDEVSEVAAALSPVPGGVGGVTSSVLASHVIRAATI